jgi:hypothetical protein
MLLHVSVLSDHHQGALGVGLTTPPRLKNIVTKSEEVEIGLICQGWHQESHPQRTRTGTTS